MISVLNSYVIMIPGGDTTPRVEAIISALRWSGQRVTRWDDGRAQIDCPDEKSQRKWMRRLQAAERDDLLESTKEEPTK